jgi:hypothetical protein
MAMSTWQLIFRQSRVNDGVYYGDRLPGHNWQWPQGTWLQSRLRYTRRGLVRKSAEAAPTRGGAFES